MRGSRGASLRGYEAGVKFGARCAPCRQVTAPVIFPRSCRRHTRLEDSASETRDSSCLSAGHRTVRLRQQLRDALHDPRHPRGDLRQVPPLLHGEAEAHGHGRTRGAVPPEVREGNGRGLSRGGPTPPGARAGGGGRPRAGRPRDRAEPGPAEAAGPRVRAARRHPPDSSALGAAARRAGAGPRGAAGKGPRAGAAGAGRRGAPATRDRAAGARAGRATRPHPSAATVAVLPEAEEVEVKIEDKDLRIDVFRSSGPGGQSVNTTDSAVRVTHLPTGIVVQCQDQKSQLQNKIKALEILRSRLLDRMLAEQEAARARDRRAMVGTGDRSAKIRTYNFPQNRVTDHRIHRTVHDLEAVLDGKLDELINALKLAGEKERLSA